MHTIYHLKSAQDITTDLLDAIKAAFKSKPIKLTIEEDNDETAFLMSNKSNKEFLLKSIDQDKNGQAVTVNITD